MTYAEKVAELERLKREIAGKRPVIGYWDFSDAHVERRDEAVSASEPATAVVEPLLISEEEARRLFPAAPGPKQVPKGAWRGRKGIPAEFVQMMYRAYERGRSIEQVAKSYGRSRQSVFETFKRRGLKLRANSKAKARIEFRYAGREFAPGKNGYLRATGGDRKALHHVIWEEFHGAIPAGQSVCFSDGNKRNFDLGNLECLPVTEVLARGRKGLNGDLKERALRIAAGTWSPKEPGEYDRAFLSWFRRHAWLISESAPGKAEVRTKGGAVCRFRVTAMMLERLEAAGYLVSFEHPNDAGKRHWALPEKVRRKAA